MSITLHQVNTLSQPRWNSYRRNSSFLVRELLLPLVFLVGPGAELGLRHRVLEVPSSLKIVRE